MHFILGIPSRQHTEQTWPVSFGFIAQVIFMAEISSVSAS